MQKSADNLEQAQWLKAALVWTMFIFHHYSKGDVVVYRPSPDSFWCLFLWSGTVELSQPLFTTVACFCVTNFMGSIKNISFDLTCDISQLFIFSNILIKHVCHR
ncbi:hypothetical protein NL108_015293 [Boleophthalmus pectinirostris]|nr:hypothetical protein NL108_015293 [Boleophthalmus pectinirostris]